MSEPRKMKVSRVILLVIAIVSFAVLMTCIVISLSIKSPIPMITQIAVLCVANLAAGFFFPIIISKITEIIRRTDASEVLWDFNEECKEAGLRNIYANRRGRGASDLAKSFKEHHKNDILIMGPSLRLFFAPDTHFRDIIRTHIQEYEKRGVGIRAVNNHLKNRSLPYRSYVEEFNPDGTHPKGNHRIMFSWQQENNWDATVESQGFDLNEFSEAFYEKYCSVGASKCRCVGDLQQVDIGVKELNSRTETGKVIVLRKTMCAPYCTAIIFPKICYLTPNLLYHSAPVDMPLLTFLRGGPVYEKVLDHFKFLWCTGVSAETQEAAL